jgi:hypothetical protein
VAKFNVTAPTGETYEVTAPEGATEAQAIAYAQAQHAPPNPRATMAPRGPATEPTAPLDQRIRAAQASPGLKLTPVSGDPFAAPKTPAAQGHPIMDALTGGAATLTRALPFLSEAEAFVGSRASTLDDIIHGRGDVAKTYADPAEGERVTRAANDAAFARIRGQQQAAVDQFKGAHPVASNLTTGVGYAAQLAAAVGTGGESAAPQAAEAQAGIRAALARFGGRTARAAPKNATVGGAFGAVNAAAQPGTLDERLRAANDAVIPSAIAGVAVPAGIDAASGAVRHTLGPTVGRMAARVAPAVRGVTIASSDAPEVRAAQAIQNAIARDAAAGHVIDPSRPLRLAGGENVAALYDVVAKSPGPGRQLLRDAIDAHGRDTSAAIRSDIGASLGGQGDYFAAQDALAKTRAANAKPDLEAAFAEPIGTAAFDQHLGPIMARLPKGALAAAQNLARMDGEPEVERGLAMLDSFGGHPVDGTPSPGAPAPHVQQARAAVRAFTRPNAADPGLEAHAGEPNMPMTENVQADAYTPTLKVMHYLKKGIDQTLEPYRNDVTRQLDLSGSPDAQAQGRVRTDLGRAMRRVSPAYDRAMTSWGDDSDGINALKLGRNAFSPKFDMQSESLARLHAEMSDEAKAQYQKGVGEAIIAKVRQSGDIRSVRQLLGDTADEFRARVALAFQDPVAFGQFVERMQGRVSDAARDARFRGGSPTYGLAAARADLEDAGTHPLDVAANVVGTHPARLAGKALAATLRALPRGTPRSAIMDPTANAALGRSGSDPDEVTRLLNMLQASRRVSAAPRLQGPAATQAGRLAAAQAGARQ